MTEPTLMNLRPNHIHLWYIPLDIEMPLSLPLSMLSIQEQQKAHQFYLESSRKKYILRRFFFRKILGFYCQVEPQSIDFTYDLYQKPCLKEHSYDIQFNTSHSGDVAILALNKNHPIGVDIECLKSFRGMSDIIDHFFSAKEKAYLASISVEKKRETFYRIWTAKEAFLKATGEGLSDALHDIEVSFENIETPKIVKTNAKNNTFNSSLNSFCLHHKERSYVTAIVSEGQPQKITAFDYRVYFIDSSASSTNNSISSQFNSGNL